MDKQIYTVSSLNQAARLLLEGNFPSLWVEGEISNLARPGSGHWYFSLKDPSAQVRCAMFRMRNRLVNFPVKDGTSVLIRAKVSLYEGRGDFQLLVEHMEEVGDGALQRAFEALKKKLAAAGLFAQERKRALPTLPQHIGVVTSATGAAIRDVLSVLKRRFPNIPVSIYATEVQGVQAAPSICKAIALAERDQRCDVLLITRGGGSLEDLYGFNDERVALAIANCSIPTVCGVGHEVDVTIADFVADLRAPTPSAAAELLVPDRATLTAQVQRAQQSLQFAMQKFLQHCQQLLQHAQARLQHPSTRLAQHAQRLDHLLLQLTQAMHTRIYAAEKQLSQAQQRLQEQQPKYLLQQHYTTLEHIQQRLQHAWHDVLQSKTYQLGQVSQRLHNLSPLATLGRGYALATDSQGLALQSIAQVNIGADIAVRLSDGQLHCRVNAKEGCE